MFSGKPRILNFDNSVISQKNLLARFHPEIIDLTSLGCEARLWISKTSVQEVKKSLISRNKKSVHFLGSGDFHHLSSLLLSNFSESISLIVFDLHSDWDNFSPRLSCSSWITHAFKNKFIQKIVIIGVSSEELSSSSVESAKLRLLSDNLLEIYPYARNPHRAFFRKKARKAELREKHGNLSQEIFWKETKKSHLGDFVKKLAKNIPTDKVYISIDKDCLRKKYALTNWEEGNFRLQELLELLGAISKEFEIEGVDISGDYSLPEPRVKEKINFNHPKDYSALGVALEEITQVNQATNIKILEFLQKLS